MGCDMATVTKGGRPSQTDGSLRIGLFDPGMTALHRAGLAGLWMTLRAIEQDEPDLAEELAKLGGAWTLGSRTVEFTWTGDGRAFFQRLIAAAFRLTPDGRFWFLGLGHPDNHRDLGCTLQEALLETLLQNPRTQKSDPGGAPGGALVLDVDGEAQTFRYRRVSWYAHQRAASTFRPNRRLEVAGWLVPGGAVRHVAFSGPTALTEPPGAWLALLFVPVGALYFRIRRRGAGIRPRFCLVLPELDGLETYDRARRLFLRQPVRTLVAAGAADAALRVLAELEAEDLLAQVNTRRCHVIAYGVVPWSERQKTRVDRFTVEGASPAALRFYRAAVHLLPPLLHRVERGAGGDEESPSDGEVLVWEVSPVLDLMGRNLASGRPWWEGFTRIGQSPETWRQFRSYEALLAQRQQSSPRGVAAVVQQPNAFDESAQTAIVEACQQAWRRRLGALAERANQSGERFEDLADRERERLRVALVHCKNADTLRATLVDFWARAGAPLPALQTGWQAVIPYIGADRWQLARDLALLALASYAGEAAGTPEQQTTTGS